MSDPKVSIGIPSYNHEKYISETIESILNQTFQDFEIIITDDGSSDDSVKIIKNFQDSRIKLYIFKENQGATKALNNCIINSKGKYFAYVSSDDAWEKDKLEKQVKYLDENPLTQVVFTKAKIIDENSNQFMDETHPYATVFEQENRSRNMWLNRFFYQGNCICHPSILIRKDIYDEIGFYNERMANLPDLDMWIRLCLKYNFHIMDEKLTKFRVIDDEKNISGNKPTTHIRGRFEKLYIYNHYLKIADNDFFLKVFPEAEKFGKLKQGMIPYFLARLAYETNQDYMQLLALDILYKFMQSDEVVEQLKNNYSFAYPDFLKMSAETDFFKIHTHLEKDAMINNRNIWLSEKDKLLLIKDNKIDRQDKLLIKKTEDINKRNLIIKEKNEAFKNLYSQIEELRTAFYEMEYLNNNHRSIIQRLISAFPSIFIMFKSGGFKRSLINIKGFKAIKKNNLFDVGYYLRNYEDVRRSGVDPLLNYIFHGYKEGRKPSSSFNGNFYQETYNDVKDSQINPLIHYSIYGIKENRKTDPN